MKKKLSELGLSENLVDEIIELFEKYDSHPHFHPPKERFTPIDELRGNMRTVANLSKRLSVALENLSPGEIRWMGGYSCPDTNALISGLHQLDRCSRAVVFSYGTDVPSGEDRVHEGRLSLCYDLKKLFERHNVPVSVYRGGKFCKTLDILLQIEADSVSDFKSSEVSKNLLRKVSQQKFTPNFF